MALKNILVKIWNKSFDLLQEGKSKAREHWDLLIVSTSRPVPRVMSIEETLDTIKCSYCSISRFGDGEIKLIAGKSLAFQPFSEELKDNLKNVISAQMPGLLVCLPDIFDRLDGFTPGSDALEKASVLLSKMVESIGRVFPVALWQLLYHPVLYDVSG